MKKYFAKLITVKDVSKLFICTKDIKPGDTIKWFDKVYKVWAEFQEIAVLSPGGLF